MQPNQHTSEPISTFLEHAENGVQAVAARGRANGIAGSHLVPLAHNLRWHVGQRRPTPHRIGERRRDQHVGETGYSPPGMRVAHAGVPRISVALLARHGLPSQCSDPLVMVAQVGRLSPCCRESCAVPARPVQSVRPSAADHRCAP